MAFEQRLTTFAALKPDEMIEKYQVIQGNTYSAVYIFIILILVQFN